MPSLRGCAPNRERNLRRVRAGLYRAHITHNPDLLKRHETEIPVLRIDGEAKDFWRINPKRMRKILDKKLAR